MMSVPRPFVTYWWPFCKSSDVQFVNSTNVLNFSVKELTPDN